MPTLIFDTYKAKALVPVRNNLSWCFEIDNHSDISGGKPLILLQKSPQNHKKSPNFKKYDGFWTASKSLQIPKIIMFYYVS